jgi:hypothetical protein
MDQWIIQRNIERFEEILQTLVEPLKRRTVEMILLAERLKLTGMESEAEAFRKSFRVQNRTS